MTTGGVGDDVTATERDLYALFRAVEALANDFEDHGLTLNNGALLWLSRVQRALRNMDAETEESGLPERGGLTEKRQFAESDVNDLLDRCGVLADSLDKQADTTRNVRLYDRLSGKAEGVRLARSYIAETVEVIDHDEGWYAAREASERSEAAKAWGGDD